MSKEESKEESLERLIGLGIVNRKMELTWQYGGTGELEPESARLVDISGAGMSPSMDEHVARGSLLPVETGGTK